MVIMIGAGVILAGCGVLMLVKGEKLLSEAGSGKKAKRDAVVIGITMILEAIAVTVKMIADDRGLTALSVVAIIAGLAILIAALALTVFKSKKDDSSDRD